MGKVRLCVFLLVLFIQHQTISAKPSFWSELFEMFSDCDSFDDDDDSSDSDSDDSKSDSSSSDSKPIFNMTLPSSKNGLSVVVEKRNGQIAVNVNSLGDSKSGDAPPEATTAATTAAAATTTAAPTTTAAKA
ncbi:DNA topoisomerase 1-like [Aricia agestis]|uniref:DNA topoisomerase 1-like n=1 Tax=Aricia agestis TaxID=91739 RepID=UPI001C201CB0|nr:DNA topoisomerase 1-like [Aricia agestis]